MWGHRNMNPFLNPMITIPFLKDLLIKPGRIQRSSPTQLQRHRNHAFRNMIAYAYTVPVYHTLYKNAGIYPRDITGLEDIKKIPFISRKDIREHFPDGILPKGANQEKYQTICTGGTTTKYCCQSGSEPVCTFTDYSTMLQGILPSIREHRYFNLNWRKTQSAVQ